MEKHMFIYGHNFNQLTSDYLNKIEAISWKGLPQFKRISLIIIYKYEYRIFDNNLWEYIFKRKY